MKFTDRCIILYAMPYSITDETTGEVNEGISTTYLPTAQLTPVIHDDGSLGIATCKQSLPSAWLPKLSVVPGAYDIDFEMRSKQGKPVLVPVDVKFVAPVTVQINDDVKEGKK